MSDKSLMPDTEKHGNLSALQNHTFDLHLYWCAEIDD